MLDAIPPRDEARLLEQSNGIGSGFMAATPNHHLHTLFTSAQYRLALKWWLGMPLVLGSNATCPGCQGAVDTHGDHLLLCPRINFTKRHAAVQETLASILTAAGQGFTREMPLPGTPNLRPADILLRSFQDGKDVAVDLTVSHGWQLSEQSQAVARDKWSPFLKRRETTKDTKYKAACEGEGWGFIPMAYGT